MCVCVCVCVCESRCVICFLVCKLLQDGCLPFFVVEIKVVRLSLAAVTVCTYERVDVCVCEWVGKEVREGAIGREV